MPELLAPPEIKTEPNVLYDYLGAPFGETDFRVTLSEKDGLIHLDARYSETPNDFQNVPTYESDEPINHPDGFVNDAAFFNEKVQGNPLQDFFAYLGYSAHNQAGLDKSYTYPTFETLRTRLDAVREETGYAPSIQRFNGGLYSLETQSDAAIASQILIPTEPGALNHDMFVHIPGRLIMPEAYSQAYAEQTLALKQAYPTSAAAAERYIDHLRYQDKRFGTEAVKNVMDVVTDSQIGTFDELAGYLWLAVGPNQKVDSAGNIALTNAVITRAHVLAEFGHQAMQEQQAV
jgi:hypothetical protein